MNTFFYSNAKKYNVKRKSTLESELIQTDLKEQENIKKCFETAKRLQDIQMANQKAIIELNQCYAKTVQFFLNYL